MEDCNNNFNSELYYNKYQIFKEDSFIKTLDSLDESKFEFVYVHIPKNGGTSLRYQIKRLIDCLITTDPNNEIENTRKMINMNHHMFRHYLYPEKLICFARNPLSRCFSMFYYHKLNKRFNNFNEFIDKVYSSKETIEFIQNKDSTNIKSKLDLLRTPRGTNVAFSWKCQCSWIPDDIFFVGKLENSQKDLERLCKIMNKPYKFINCYANKGNYSESAKESITPETKRRIYEIYKQDYNRFNYSFE